MTDDPTLTEERVFELMDETGTSVGLGFLSTAGFSRFARPVGAFGSDRHMGWVLRAGYCWGVEIDTTVSVGVRRLEEAGLLKCRTHLQTNAPFSYLTVKDQSLRRQ